METEDKNRELLKATQDGDFVGVTRLLELGADPNYPQEKGTNRRTTGYTALIYAAQLGHEEIVGLLLRGGADVNLTSFWGVTPLWAAMARDHTSIVLYLLENGAAIEHAENSMMRSSLLHLAISNHNIRLTEMMLDAGADIETVQGLVVSDGVRYFVHPCGAPLSQAIWSKDMAIASLLLGRGAAPDKYTVPYVLATGDIEFVRLVLDGGVRPDLADEHTLNMLRDSSPDVQRLVRGTM